MKKLYLPVFLGLMLVWGCESTPVHTAPTTGLDDVYEAFVGDDPEYLYIHRPAFAENYDRYKGRYTPLEHQSKEAQKNRIQDALQKWQSIDTTNWTLSDQLHYQSVGHFLRTASETIDVRSTQFPFNPVDGIHLKLMLDLGLGFTFEEQKDTEYYSDRLRNYSKQLSSHLAQTQQNASKKTLPPRYMLEAVRAQVDTIAQTPASKNLLLRALARQLGKADPVTINEYTAANIVATTEGIIQSRIQLAYTKLLPYIDEWIAMADTTLPRCDDPAVYATNLKRHLGFESEVDSLHNWGLSQMEKYQKMMNLDALPTFRADSEVLYDVRNRIFVGDSANAYLRRMQRNARGLFDSIPESRPELVEMPDIALAYTPMWGYLPGAMDGTRKGVQLMDRTHPEFASLEKDQVSLYTWGIPGTHFSQTVHHELLKIGNWPRMIQYHGSQAGWRLFTADLVVKELGLLSSDPAKFARYHQHQVLALAKLVTDTGFHLQNWSRTQCLNYLTQYTGISNRQAQYIVDRMILYPGEAASEWLAYQELIQLQVKAKEIKGDDYLLQDFYQLVLNFLHFPLDILNNSMNELL